MKNILLKISKIGNLLLSFFNLAMFFAIRMCWSGISKTLGYEEATSKFMKMFIYYLPVAIFFILIGLFILNIILYKYKKEKNLWSYIMNGVNMIFFIAIIVIIALGAIDYMTYAWPYFFDYCFIASCILLVYFLIFIYPRTELYKNKRVTHTAFSLVLVITIGYLTNSRINAITCKPVVYIVEDKYQIVFASKVESRSWVTIGDTDYYDNYAGSNRSYTKIHKIEIPMTELNEHKEYTIHTQKLTYRGPFGGFKGRDIHETYNFIPVDTKDEDGFNYYAISDIHMALECSKKAVSYNESKDLLVLAGDIVSMMETEKDALYTNKVAHELTKGEIPVIYARGNHEIKGKLAEEFHNYVGAKNENFYYSFSFENVYGLVLDIGEDHDDDYWEYYDTAKFDIYREEQINFIKEEMKSEKYKNADYRLVVSHIPVTFVNSRKNHEGFKQDLVSLLNDMNVNMVISGHQHDLFVFDPGEVEPNVIQNYNVAFDGKGKNSKEYVLDFKFPSFCVSKRGYTQTDSAKLTKMKSQIGLSVKVDFVNKIQECEFNNSKGELVNIVNQYKDIDYGTKITFSLENNLRIK